MNVDTALARADEWTEGATFHEQSEGWKPGVAVLAHEVRRLRAQVAKLEAAQRWQPMESAPMDGSRILLDEGEAAVVGWYETGPSMGAFGEPLNDWTDGMETAGGYDCGYRLIVPKSWARLPEPKAQQ